VETRRNPLTRLSNATLTQATLQIRRPSYKRALTTIGVVHFGPGAFHRAHQAAYFDRLLAADPRWAICEVSLKSPGVRDALAPQDGLYTLLELGVETRMRVIGAIRELLVAAEEPRAVMDRLASPDVRLVTLTVTEKGYCLTPAGDLDTGHADIVADVATPDRPSSVIGWLVAGLARRRAEGQAAFTTLSCDNLPSNGRKLKAAVVALAAARDPALADWIKANARFPCTMVDSITPATDDALRLRVEAGLGLEDAWPIQREHFMQWVIEDDLGPAHDALAVLATLTDDVEGWEKAKLRLLNGAHSTLAYAGILRGRQSVRDAMADAPLAAFVERMMLEDIAPTVRPPAGLCVPTYVQALLERFRNPSIEHRLSQIAWDGSQKLPIRILATVADALAAGRPLDRLALPVAAWMRFVMRQAGGAVVLTDPLAGRLAKLGLACNGDAAHDVPLFLALETVFPPALAAEPVFRDAVTKAYARLPELPA
jgi:fructuronate reductase